MKRQGVESSAGTTEEASHRATSIGIISAQPKQEYAPKAQSKKLVETSLHGVDGKKVTIQQFTLPPGYVGGKHYHTGPTFVYVARGTLTIDETGKSRQTFPSGQVDVEPIGTPMIGRNVVTSGRSPDVRRASTGSMMVRPRN